MAPETDAKRQKSTLRKIERAWKIGRQFVDDGHSIEELRREHNAGYEYVRQCRKFADTYTETDYKRLLTQIAKHRNPLGYSFVWKFVSISDAAQRRKIQQACIKEKWGRARLQAENIALRGRVKHGGRRRSVTGDIAGCMVKLDQEVDRWLRLLDNIARATKLDEVDLPPAVNDQLFVTWKEVRVLRDKLNRALNRNRG
jgi:hypothetical protein